MVSVTFYIIIIERLKKTEFKQGFIRGKIGLVEDPPTGKMER